MTPEEKLAEIRALWMQSVPPNDFYLSGFPDRVAELAEFYDKEIAEQFRAVLDAPSSPAPATVDRDAIIDAYQRTWEEYQRPSEGRPLFREALADHILALVGSGAEAGKQPTPAPWTGRSFGNADASVAPSGVRLTPDEAALVARFIRGYSQLLVDSDAWAVLRALAERLEREARP